MKIKTHLVMTSLALMLAACGGGGDTGSIINPPIDVIRPSDLQTVVPQPTYNTSTANSEAFHAINAFRASLGLGLWAQNTKLDLAAQNHVDYLVANREYSHDEVNGRPGFTGNDATTRATHVGYTASWVGDVGSRSLGADGVAALIDTVYHRSALMNQSMTEVGIGNSAHPGHQVQFVSFSNAIKTQHNASDYTAVYPLDGQNNVPLFMMKESIDPFPRIKQPSAPITFVSAYGTKLTVSHFTVAVRGSKMILVTELLTEDNDPNKMYLSSNEAHIANAEPFLPNTTYDVSFAGMVNKVVVKKEWSFTTGSH